MRKKLYYKTEGSGIPLILIHGFTGSHESFDIVSNYLKQYFKIIKLDMIGHGFSMDYSEQNYSFSKSIKYIENIINELNLKKVNIVGYSLGGRLAMQYAINNYNEINKLILCSSSFGIEKKSERISRIKSDKKIIDLLMNNKITKFVNYWEGISLWDSEKKLSVETKQKNRNIRLNQNNEGLLMSLRYQGQGVQEFLGKYLKNIKSKTLIMYGEKDFKYKEISKIMSEIIENSELDVVSNSGHNIILENPIYVSQKIKNFILGEK
tara:strand:+ start:8616 stop:9410 length:795 start_codon:yes stop_codon:yes gene_type:complete